MFASDCFLLYFNQETLNKLKIKKNFYKEIKDENINLFSNPFGNGDSAIKILDIIENEN